MTGSRLSANASHDRANSITVIVGKKGSGKTTIAKRLARESDRRLTIDPMFEYRDGVIVNRFETLITYVRPRRFASYSVILRSMDQADVEALIEFLTDGDPNRPPLPGVTVTIDEIDKLCSPVSIPESLSRLVNYGRHFGVSIVAISRRPRAMHRDITANADRIIVGQTQEPRDLDYLAEFVGESFARRAGELKPFEFLSWPEDGELAQEAAQEPARDAIEPEAEPEPEEEPADVLGAPGNGSEDGSEPEAGGP